MSNLAARFSIQMCKRAGGLEGETSPRFGRKQLRRCSPNEEA